MSKNKKNPALQRRGIAIKMVLKQKTHSNEGFIFMMANPQINSKEIPYEECKDFSKTDGKLKSFV